MEKSQKRNVFIITAVALYFTYFIHGIGVSILAQYKQEFAKAWGGNIGLVLQVSSVLGLGRLLALPFAGPMSDKLGRKITAVFGIFMYLVFFLGMARSRSLGAAYVYGIIGGAANSFLDTSVIPSVLEIFEDRGDVASMFTKFSMSLGQFVLPFGIGIVAKNSLSYRSLFYLAAILLALDGILILFLNFPKFGASENSLVEDRMKFDSGSISLILIGFTATATFQLWLNCNQELGLLYGMADPSKVQSLYALGTVCAILFSSFFMLKKFKPVEVLVIYPFISLLSLIAVYFIRTALMMKLGGFLMGFFAAGGVLQLVTSTANAMYPKNKGKITSIVMMASSIGSYIVLFLAGKITDFYGASGPLKVVLLNIVVTILGVVLALHVRRKFRQEEAR